MEEIKILVRREQEDSFAEAEKMEATAAAAERLKSGRKAAAKARSGHQLPAPVPMGRAHHILAAGVASCSFAHHRREACILSTRHSLYYIMFSTPDACISEQQIPSMRSSASMPCIVLLPWCRVVPFADLKTAQYVTV